jgi:hypothetical protein
MRTNKWRNSAAWQSKIVTLLGMVALSSCGGASQSGTMGPGGAGGAGISAAGSCNVTISGGSLSVDEPCKGSWTYDSNFLRLSYNQPDHKLITMFYPVDLKTLPLTLSPNHPSSHSQEWQISYQSVDNASWSLPDNLKDPKDGFTLQIDQYMASIVHGTLAALLEPADPSGVPVQFMMTF